MSTTRPPVTIHVYRQFSEIPLDEASWDKLVEASAVGGVFLKYLWVSNWWRCFGHSFELFFVTAETDGRILAFLPLMLDKQRTLRFIGDLNADYLGFVIPSTGDALLGAFIEFLSKKRGNWDSIHLRNIPRPSLEWDAFFESCRQNSLYPWNNYSVTAPFLRVAGQDHEIASLLDKESFRRSERLLRTQGELHYEVFRSVDEARPLWQQFADQHIARCHRANRQSNFENPAYLPFLRSLFETDHDHAIVHFSALFLDKRPIAFHFGLISQGRLLWYKPSFDVLLTRGSPGVTLACNLIRFAQRTSLGELDFTIGEEPFKSRFCKEFRTVDDFRIHQSRLRYIADTGYTRVRRAAKALVKSNG